MFNYYFLKLIFIKFLFLNLNYCLNFSIDPSKFIVWGPGLEADINLPFRYFFIQTVDGNWKNITDSLGEDKWKVKWIDENGRDLRIKTDVYDNHDGSFIIIYKLYDSFPQLFLHLFYNNKHVAQSPYNLGGPFFHEECDCPHDNFDEWLNMMGCNDGNYNINHDNDNRFYGNKIKNIVNNDIYKQLNEDFNGNWVVNMSEGWKKMSKEFNRPLQMSLVHYVVKDNKLYYSTLGKYVGFKQFFNKIILSLMRKVKLPDLDFVMNLGDWPLVSRQFINYMNNNNKNNNININKNKRYKIIKDFLVISWCGSEDSEDLVLPTYDVTLSILDANYRNHKQILTMKSLSYVAWKQKINKLFWRGRDSSNERLKLVRMSDKDKIDAGLTHIFFFKSEKDLNITNSVPFHQFFKYKYQINLDGTVAAYRMPFLLGGGSLVFKQQSKYYEHFYKQLKNNKEYIEINRDLSNLNDKLNWALLNDKQSRIISENGVKFSMENLLPQHIFCYHALFFKKYSEKIISEIKILKGMKKIKGKEGEEEEEVEVEKGEKETGNGWEAWMEWSGWKKNPCDCDNLKRKRYNKNKDEL